MLVICPGIATTVGMIFDKGVSGVLLLICLAQDGAKDCKRRTLSQQCFKESYNQMNSL
jgi:hypothetical protein